jgi:hypothetical protein
MKKYLKTGIKRLLTGTVGDLISKEIAGNQVAQKHLSFHYQWLRNQGASLPSLTETGFRAYSQNDEDGLLLYIFSLIGTTNKVCVEVAFGSPFGANTTNLICNWGWGGLLMEGNARLADQATAFFASHKDTCVFPPTVVNAWVTAENINDLLQKNGITGEIDFFSLDVDGMDYWIWKALEVIHPRVVVVEAQAMWGAERAVTVPYDPSFNRFDQHPDFFGASLSAFVKLGRDKGYRLIGCNKYGFNVFFMRTDIADSLFPTVAPESCLQYSAARESRQRRLQEVKDLGWVEV